MNIAFAPIGLLILLIVPAFLVGFIVLLIKGGPAVRWFFGILLLLLVIGFFGLFYMRIASHQPAVVSSLSPPQVAVQEGSVYIEKDPTLWSDGLEEELKPDIYSSLEAAAYGVGIQLDDVILSASDNQPPNTINIVDNNDSEYFVLFERLREQLSEEFKDSKVVINTQRTPSPDNICIKLEIERNNELGPAFQDGIDLAAIAKLSKQTGLLRAIVLTENDKHILQVPFDERLWLTEPETFRSKLGNRFQGAVITSNEPAVTKEQADEQVRQAAMEYLANQLQIGSRVGTAVRDSDLWDYGLVADEYSQRLVGLSGPIWRAALLLDVSPERIQTLRQQKMVVQHQARKNWIQHFLSLIGMLVLITILYVFVNAITKGYYSKTILIVSILGFLVFLFLFWA